MSEPTVVPLNREFFGEVRHTTTEFNATVPAGTTVAQLQDPAFWVHVRNKMKTHDEIRVVAEDSSFVGRLIVHSVDAFGVVIRPIYMVALEAPNHAEAAAMQSRYEVKHRGQLKWCVVDTLEKKNVKEGLHNQSDAQRELEELIRAMAR